MQFSFYSFHLSIILSLISLSFNEMEKPPVAVWDKTLSDFFNSHNETNYINIEPKVCLNNESLYLFVMQTILKIEGIKDDAETLGYTGFCLQEHNSTTIEQSLINYYYLWDKGNMNGSSLIEIQNLNEGPNIKEKYHIRMKFFGAILIIYFLFMIISTAFPKKIEDKYNIKEFERIKKERESDDEDNDNNIDNINNDDYNNNYNLFKINNDEDKPPAEIIAGPSKEKNNQSSKLNNSNDFANSENNKNNDKEDELINDKDSKPLIKEINIYNELFNNKTKMNQLWNSFNIWGNLKILGNIFSLKSFSQLNQVETEIFIMETFKWISYQIMMIYSCIPIIERLPIKHPEKFFNLVKHPLLVPIINGNYFYNTVFLIEGLSISYFYLFNKKNYCLSYILMEIIYKIIPLHFLISFLYFVFVNSHILLDTPLSRYFFEKDRVNCECQEINILLFIANFTYGMKDKFFPFCLYHFWFVFNLVQNYIVGMFLLLCYVNFKSFFYVIFLLIFFIGFLLRLISLNIYAPPVSIFNVLKRNLKPYYQRQGIKIFTRGGPFLIGFFFGIYYYKNKKRLLKSKKHNGKILFFSIIIFIALFIVQHCINLELLEINNLVMMVLLYFFKIFKYDIFSLCILGLLFYFFINAKTSGQIFRFFNNPLFLLMKKLSLTSYLIFSIVARIFFYSFKKEINIKMSKILTYIFWGTPITLFIGFLLNLLFVVPLENVNLIIKSTYIPNLE